MPERLNSATTRNAFAMLHPDRLTLVGRYMTVFRHHNGITQAS